MFISMDAEKTSDTMQHPFMIKLSANEEYKVIVSLINGVHRIYVYTYA